MYTDAENRPSNNQSLAGVASTTALSTDSIDLIDAKRELGRGMPIRAVVKVTLGFTVATSVAVELVESADAALGSPTVLAGPVVTALAGLTLGATIFDQIVPATSKRFIGFRYTTVGTPGVGKVSAFLLADTDRTANNITMNTGR